MLLSVVKISLVLALLAGFLRGTSLLGEKGRLGAEALRKTVHVGLGSACLTFPWVFSSVLELAALFTGVLALLLAVRSVPFLRAKYGGGLYGVKRDSVGDLLFGLSVFLLFVYARDVPALYVLPLLILTLSDSAAALAGVHFGRHSFEVPAGWKSWEGTIVFCVVTVLLSLLVLGLLTDAGPARIICIALLLGLVGCLVEAVSWHGWDNLFVPLGMHLLLGGLLEKSPQSLALTLLFLVGLIVCIRKLSRFGELTVHALIGAAIAAFFFWETGGPLWLAGPFIVFVCHVLLACLQGGEDEYGIGAVLSVVSCGIAWLFVGRHTQYHYAFLLFVLSMAIHLQIMVLLRIRALREKPAEYPLVLAVSFFSGWMFMPVLLLAYETGTANILLYASCLAIMAGGGVLFRVRGESCGGGRWFQQTFYAMAGSILGLVPVWILAR